MSIERTIAATAELTGASLTAQAIAVMVADLAEYPAGDVTEALTRCRRECRRGLTLADIIDRMPSQPPGPDEAWELALRAEPWLPRGETLVIPRAIKEAFPFKLVAANDMYGARLAFRAAYPEAKRKHGRQVYLRIGEGETLTRAQVLTHAVERGIIPHTDVPLLLEAPREEY